MSEKKLYKISSGWGNRLEFTDWDTRKVSGHKSNPPSVGDYLESEMGSGKMALFRFIKVDRKKDPPDMFFGVVEDVGYRDDVDCKALGIPEEESKVMFL